MYSLITAEVTIFSERIISFCTLDMKESLMFSASEVIIVSAFFLKFFLVRIAQVIPVKVMIPTLKTTAKAVALNVSDLFLSI